MKITIEWWTIDQHLNDETTLFLPFYLCYIAELRSIHTVLKLIYCEKEDDYYQRWRTNRVLYISSLSLLPYLFNIIYINRVSQNTN